ncbi:MAG: methyltransferase small [Bacteroidetes bacterium]|nr:methyltransferase small [Bacteroidota bacterium]
MKRFYKKIAEIFVRPVLLYYLRKDRYYSYEGTKVSVKKGVFHPGFFFSTKFFLGFLQKANIANKTLLELGAGSGLISMMCAKRGAIVTAVDINPLAIESIRESAKLNNLKVEAYQSDLFTSVPKKTFDYIIINPPYYRRQAKTIEQQAWFAGENFEYFVALFSSIDPYFTEDSKVFICFSEDCEFDTIQEIARKHGYNMFFTYGKKIAWEYNVLFLIGRYR